MRSLQRSVFARAIVAIVISAGLSLLAWRVGVAAMLVLLFVSLLVLSFVVLTVAPDVIAYQRKHEWRWWWRASNDDGPFWPGTCVPRHPRS